jgi:perosamine synthetase
LPATFEGKRIGAVSDLTAFSFYATKTITTAEGGMLTTDNEQYAVRASQMRLHGISGDAWKRYSREGSWYYEVLNAGYKLNLTDMQSALGLAQLKKADQFWSSRQQIAEFYLDRLSAIDELELPPEGIHGQHSWHLFILRIRPELLRIGRNAFIARLKEMGIGTSVHFIPLHLHPYYQHEYGYRAGDFPNAEDAYNRCFSLPIYPDLSLKEMLRIVDAVEQVVWESKTRVLVAAS